MLSSFYHKVFSSSFICPEDTPSTFLAVSSHHCSCTINLVTLPYHSSLCQLLTELCSVVLFLQLLTFNHRLCLDVLPFLDFQSHPTDKHQMVPTYFAVKKSFPFPISSFFVYLSYVLDQTNGNTKQRLYSVFNWAVFK